MSILSALKSALAGEKPNLSNSEMAKQRLYILLPQDRAGINSPEFLSQLRRDIVEVLKKYVPIITNDDVEIKYDNTDDTHIIEMSISLESDDSISNMSLQALGKSIKQDQHNHLN